MEPHTQAKHELVRRYLGGWFPILGTYSGRVVFLDGFAGPGIYANGEPGSPIIALQALLDHPRFSHLRCEFIFLFLEPESDRAESLERRLVEFAAERGGLPHKIRYHVRQSTFVDAATEIVSTLEEQKSQLAPTFAFIDPFGFSGVPIELIGRLLDFDKCEVFFNLMYDYINRFATAGNVDRHLREVFGCDDYRSAGALPEGRPRSEFLHDLYERQLRSVGGFPYLQRFQMFNQRNHNVYSLYFGTRNLAGLRVMKDAMWRVDPGSGCRFSDRTFSPNQPVLFEAEPNFGPLRQAILSHFVGRTVPVSEVEEFTLTQTPYSASHYNRPVLSPLEKEGAIEVLSSPRKKRYTFPDGTVIRFSS
jgi:three-Cys-motif partner protein